jgi:hypothetical protein
MVSFASSFAVARQRVRYSTWSGGALVATICFASIGCSDSNMVRVRGAVKNEGQIVSGGSVVFMPVGDSKPAFGAIQPDGTFQLTTLSPNDGAMIGQYQVSVTGARNPETEVTGPTYIGPPDLLLEVAAGKDNEFQIHIRKADGWQAAVGG